MVRIVGGRWKTLCERAEEGADDECPIVDRASSFILSLKGGGRARCAYAIWPCPRPLVISDLRREGNRRCPERSKRVSRVPWDLRVAGALGVGGVEMYCLVMCTAY